MNTVQKAQAWLESYSRLRMYVDESEIITALLAERQALLEALKPICEMQENKFGDVVETHVQLVGLAITGRKAIQLCEESK